MPLADDNPPEQAPELPQDLLRKLSELQASPYYAHVNALRPEVVGRDVLKTEAGTSGFVLHLIGTARLEDQAAFDSVQFNCIIPPLVTLKIL